MGGRAGGGEGGGQKKLKNLTDLLAVHLPRWKRPKREESTIDRMAILPMAAMPTKETWHTRPPTQSPTLKSLTTLTNAQCMHILQTFKCFGTLLYSIFMYLIMYAL